MRLETMYETSSKDKTLILNYVRENNFSCETENFRFCICITWTTWY